MHIIQYVKLKNTENFEETIMKNRKHQFIKYILFVRVNFLELLK